MTMRRRFVWIFIRQWLTVGAITAICIVMMFFWIAEKMTELDLKRNFSRVALESIMDAYSLREDGSPHISPRLLKQVEENGGWLQVLNEQGEATTAYFTPPDVPAKYKPGQLIDYFNRQQPFPYRLYILIRPIEGEMVTLLYGVKEPLDTAASVLAEDSERFERLIMEARPAESASGFDEWPMEIRYCLEEYEAGIQLLSPEGKELLSYRLPSGVPQQYSPQDLVLRLQYPERYGMRMEMRTEPGTERIWLVHAPYYAAAGIGLTPLGPTVNSEGQLMMYGFGSLLLILLLACGGLALWQGNKFGLPMLHVMRWLEHLAHRQYKEPIDRHGRPISKRRSGRLKRRYKAYAEVVDSVQKLSQQLEQHELEREQSERMREEWIAGLSHDLKTPLSSIYGYAQLLRSGQYEWEREEVTEFAATMVEKAEYMDELIQDLNLLYRLKHASDTLHLECRNMNEVAGDAVAHIAQDPAWSPYKCEWVPAPEEIYYRVDPIAFRRMMDNIMINAMLHNPQGTQLKVRMQKGPGTGFALQFEDNGTGMDETTRSSLFHRYYRGTATDRIASGSGLGMAIAKEIAEAHGGTVEVRSAVGRGTLITVSFSEIREDTRQI
ncbi:HAMP domain-containing sensor histidine kinase [Paenibacillus woosongensis]|uniref:histidine kinase n=1 Tax=Paenibacillus woosongensis TaxID=307580 RepID=A0AA95I0N2_9BACL|nr:HAMP domain-containing sensor histidine kinase [Paenibacillus woosongensis]WHX47580.1 HAMP domain-containing sensor histidine kinase [Paenibacillus woosongensis]